MIFDGSEYLLWDASGPAISLETPDVDHVQVCGISADGSTVVGRAEFLNSGSNIARTARWSEQGGWQDLGDTLLTPSGPVPASGGLTHHASSDGSRIVGGTRLDSGLLRPFVWTAATGMVELEADRVRHFESRTMARGSQAKLNSCSAFGMKAGRSFIRFLRRLDPSRI